MPLDKWVGLKGVWISDRYVRPAVAAFALLLDRRQTEHEEACGERFGHGTTFALAEGLAIGALSDADIASLPPELREIFA